MLIWTGNLLKLRIKQILLAIWWLFHFENKGFKFILNNFTNHCSMHYGEVKYLCRCIISISRSLSTTDIMPYLYSFHSKENCPILITLMCSFSYSGVPYYLFIYAQITSIWCKCYWVDTSQFHLASLVWSPHFLMCLKYDRRQQSCLEHFPQVNRTNLRCLAFTWSAWSWCLVFPLNILPHSLHFTNPFMTWFL